MWITSPAGEPFCVVFEPRVIDDTRRDRYLSLMSAGVARFTGTFLKMVSYSASDGKRLAPLIVGERPPIYAPGTSVNADANLPRDNSAEVFRIIGGNNASAGRRPSIGANWVLALVMAIVAAGIITWQHVRTPVRRHRSVQHLPDRLNHDDPPPEFIN